MAGMIDASPPRSSACAREDKLMLRKLAVASALVLSIEAQAYPVIDPFDVPVTLVDTQADGHGSSDTLPYSSGFALYTRTISVSQTSNAVGDPDAASGISAGDGVLTIFNAASTSSIVTLDYELTHLFAGFSGEAFGASFDITLQPVPDSPSVSVSAFLNSVLLETMTFDQAQRSTLSVDLGFGEHLEGSQVLRFEISGPLGFGAVVEPIQGAIVLPIAPIPAHAAGLLGAGAALLVWRRRSTAHKQR